MQTTNINTVDFETLRSVKTADSGNCFWRGVHIRQNDGVKYLVVDQGNETDTYIVEDGDDDENSSEKSLLENLHTDDMDVVEWANIHGDGFAVANKETSAECKIVVRHDYNGPYSNYSWLEDSGQSSFVGDYKTCKEKIREFETDTYYLEHNENGRPEYFIIEE